MKLLDRIKEAAGNAASRLEERNRKAAAANRLRTVIRCEEAAAEKEYLALGRYFYNNLRDKGNDVTEAHCAELEEIEARLEKALDQLEQLYQTEDPIFVPEEEKEEITLEDVECFDHDPDLIPEGTPAETAEVPAEKPEVPVSAVDDGIAGENADLPFEG
ncbi:MAG: hypothetical protein J1E06_07275 [Acutalibacter sp.]|nr:hypothetical protein [Acutalibacter sp.]